MSAVTSAPAPAIAALSMLELLADPKRTQDVLAQFEKARNEAESAQREVEETILALNTKQEAISQREAVVTNREVEVDNAEASLNQAKCDWETKSQKTDIDLATKASDFEKMRLAEDSRLSKWDQDLTAKEGELNTLGNELSSKERDLSAREAQLILFDQQYEADKKALEGWIAKAKELVKGFSL